MAINNINFSSIEQIQALLQKNGSTLPKTGAKAANSFSDILTKQLNTSPEVKFSKHANERLASRNIELSEEQIIRLEDGIIKAKSKGVKESLMLIDNVALVVNIPNNTVITAVGKEDTLHNVFTNIDGAVIV
jgi:flagellar operon protein